MILYESNSDRIITIKISEWDSEDRWSLLPGFFVKMHLWKYSSFLLNHQVRIQKGDSLLLLPFCTDLYDTSCFSYTLVRLKSGLAYVANFGESPDFWTRLFFQNAKILILRSPLFKRTSVYDIHSIHQYTRYTVYLFFLGNILSYTFLGIYSYF